MILAGEDSYDDTFVREEKLERENRMDGMESVYIWTGLESLTSLTLSRTERIQDEARTLIWWKKLHSMSRFCFPCCVWWTNDVEGNKEFYWAVDRLSGTYARTKAYNTKPGAYASGATVPRQTLIQLSIIYKS